MNRRGPGKSCLKLSTDIAATGIPKNVRTNCRIRDKDAVSTCIRETTFC